MKKFLFSTGFIILLVVVYSFVKYKINNDYYDYKTIKLKDREEHLILRRNSKLVILTLSNQSVDHKTANFEWCIGDESTFDLSDSSTFKYGTGLTGDGIKDGIFTPIKFDAYRFYWSPNMNGEGFVYLNYYPRLNEEVGAFSWTVVSADPLTNFLIKKSASSKKIIDIKEKSLIRWFSE